MSFIISSYHHIILLYHHKKIQYKTNLRDYNIIQMILKKKNKK